MSNELSNKRSFEFYVAGVQHRNFKEFIHKVKGDEGVFFEFEPLNPFDKHAVKVLLDVEGNLIHIGYVPKKISREVKELIRSSDNPVGEMVKFTPGSQPWNMFKVKIYDYADEDFDDEDYQVTTDDDDEE